jgi:transcriptional regulator with XRE-family HTH domain
LSDRIAALLVEARRILQVSQGALGEMLGSSQRTGQRWETGGSPPSPAQLHELARLVHPTDAPLAAQIAAAGGSSLEQLGIVPLAPPLPPPAPPDPKYIVDTVVCAAAEAMQLMPDAIRPALRAAFRRAKLAGLSVQDVDKALHGREGPDPESRPEGPARSKQGVR